MNQILTVDFGSTFTKISIISLSEKRVIATAKAFTTIETDICIGFENAIKELKADIGKFHYDEIISSSSAGGGLKMVACGLVPELTAKAARIAANSAGAKVVKTFSYELSRDEQNEIFEIQPDIILLSGGTDGGNKEVIIHNARMLAEIDGKFSVIAAGNKSAASAVEEILKNAGKHVIICKNVMPVFNALEIDSAKNAIRNLFIEKIIIAKGLNKAQKMMAEKIIPTPLAVFEAAELLSKGTNNIKGLGQILATDIGGATTDVYTMCDGKPKKTNVIEKGLPEPFAKRTVEGDLGLRYGMPSLIETVGVERISFESGASEYEIRAWEKNCRKNPDTLATSDSINKTIDDSLAALALETAVERHAGALETAYTPFGETFIQTGKDLTDVKYIIGIGGPLINSADPVKILKRAFFSNAKSNCLKPTQAKILLDKKYIFAAMGLISKKNPDIALQIMLDEITEV